MATRTKNEAGAKAKKPDAKAKKADTDANRPDALKGISPETALKLMEDMLLFRRFEEKAEEGYAIGKIGGFCHLHIGQEAAAAGSIGVLRKDDYAISAYREHTQAIAKGIDPKAVMAELFGRKDGCSGGKGGSMHLFDTSVRFMGGHGIVGAQTALALGMAWAIHYRDGDQVVVCFMGDAAVNQGAFHESMNMAAIWNLPVIYVVENNDYGMGTAFSRVSKTRMEAKSASHGVPAHVIDGQDVLETYARFEEIVADVRVGAGPQFVDLQCYRFKGHSMSDPASGTYRSKDEVEGKMEKEDPIRILREVLTEAGHLDDDRMQELDEAARARAQEAFDFADESPLPDETALYTDVYAELNPNGRLFFDARERPGFAS